ncbi:MAG TPA: NUDIX domain-containing protein [Fimbriimonadales bacterium]|nr:NUDIX domain-containing protein [Fimbriimonadales bacterium]
MVRKYPKAKWEEWEVEFFPAPFRPPTPASYVLVFLWKGDKTLLSYIPERGWCIPGGKVKTNEDSRDAAIREAYEETGAKIADIQFMGSYKLSKNGEVRWADVYTSKITELDEIPEGSEATNRGFYSLEEIPHVYFAWNPLFEILFLESFEKLK